MTPTEKLKQEKNALISRYAQRNNGFALYQILSTAIPFFALLYGAIASMETSYWLTALCIALLVLFTLRVFVMLHDAGHGCLFDKPAYNTAAGFFMGVLCGVPEYVWSRHHAYHHSTNGNWQKYKGPLAVLSSEEFSALNAKQQRGYQRGRNILLAPFAGFMYFIFNPRFTWLKGTLQLAIHLVKSGSVKKGLASFETPFWANWKEYRHMAANNLILIPSVIVACWYFGTAEFLFVYVTGLSLAGALGLILFVVQHNFENAYAVDDSNWDYHTAALEGTSYLKLPRILHWFTADIGYHHVHHLSARIPNYKLRECHEAYRELFKDVPRLHLGDILHSFQYIIWDQASGRLITVAQHKERYQSEDSEAPSAA